MSEQSPPPKHETAIARILDANINRATEGLRVAEEYARFLLEDAHLARLCKETRHDLTQACSAIESRFRWHCRETQYDVGTSISTDSEYRRISTADVLSANFARTEQALRAIEEYGKVVLPKLAATVEPLRYRVYTLQRAMAITAAAIDQLADARIYALLDGCQSADEFERTAKKFVDASVDIIQLREKQLSDLELLGRARCLRRLTAGTRVLCVINDRPDIAAISGADGVHLGQDDLTVKDARSILGANGLIGVSTHSIEQARQAVLDGANYLGCGPTFPSTTKSFESFPGLEFLRQVAAEIRLPAFAIGGISLGTLNTVADSGIHGVAVGAALRDAGDIASDIATMRAAFLATT